ncbi:MAG: protein-disulfide reductase DsbD N-terminal domain-containing protein [Proteobacteria bacterium]|nr:protein-disulfide reductase DsbD N-terminal domain-containing protein [Pseudomonadota bacterium]MDA1332195.1 protein-disulfide reductase DsbD N-terminal domain-containing protein [Pseudomonadota bacterium]
MTRMFVLNRCIVALLVFCCFPQFVVSSRAETPGASDFYRLSATLVKGNKLVLAYDIHPCCYLYKRSFSFQVLDSDVIVSQVSFPESLRHNDEFFGEVEIYRGEVLITLDLNFTRVGRRSDSLSVTAWHQGCSDEGICFLPDRNVLSFTTFPGPQ